VVVSADVLKAGDFTFAGRLAVAVARTVQCMCPMNRCSAGLGILTLLPIMHSNAVCHRVILFLPVQYVLPRIMLMSGLNARVVVAMATRCCHGNAAGALCSVTVGIVLSLPAWLS